MNDVRHERAARTEPKAPHSPPFEVEDHTDPENMSALMEVIAAARWVHEQREQGLLPN